MSTRTSRGQSGTRRPNLDLEGGHGADTLANVVICDDLE